jgi:hypothetical protein
MLALIRKYKTLITASLTLIAAFTFVACASHKNMALVDDPNGDSASSIPWNKQEKWENTGPLSGLTDRR